MKYNDKRNNLLKNGHGEVLTSPPFVSLLVDIFVGTYEKILGYENFKKFKVPKVGMKVIYDPEDSTTAYTDGNRIVINAGNRELVPSHLDLGVKKDVVTGLMLHEQGHILYTDFSALKGIFLNFTDNMLEAGFSQEFVDRFENSKSMENAFQEIYANWNNILEDGVIEPQIYHKVYGRSKYGLTALRSIHYGSMNTFEEINEGLEEEMSAKKKILALFSLFLTYGKFNSFKVVEHSSLYKDTPASDLIKRGYDSAMMVLTEKDPSKRPMLSLKALVPFEEELAEIFNPDDFLTNEEFQELKEQLQQMLEESGSEAYDSFEDFLEDIDSKSELQADPMDAEESASNRDSDDNLSSSSDEVDKDQLGSSGDKDGSGDGEVTPKAGRNPKGPLEGEVDTTKDGDDVGEDGRSDNKDSDEKGEDTDPSGNSDEKSGSSKEGSSDEDGSKSDKEGKKQTEDKQDQEGTDDSSGKSDNNDQDESTDGENDSKSKQKAPQNQVPQKAESNNMQDEESTLAEELEALGEDTKRDSIVGDDGFDGFNLDGLEEVSNKGLNEIYEEISKNVDFDALESLVDRYLDLQKEQELELEAEKQTMERFEAAMDTSFLDRNIHAGIRHRLNVVNVNDEIPNHLMSQFKPYSNALATSVEKVLNRRVKAPYGSSYSGRKLNNSRLYSRNKDIFKPVKPNIKKEKLALFVLVDQSGSMFGERMTSARLASLVLYDFCNTLDIPVMIAGHNTSGNNSVDLDVYTDFDKKEKQDYAAIASMSTRGANRDGYALSWAYSMLDKRREEKKLLIIINDGQPSDYGYSGSVARNDIKNLKKIYEARGIQTVAAAIGDDFDMIKAIYDDSFVGISNLKELPIELGDILKKTVLR